MKKSWVIDSLYYVTGSALFALSVSVFSTPNDIAPGGVTGLAIIGHALFSLPVGTGVLLLNVPLLVTAFLVLSRRFALRTAVVTVVSSAVIDITAPLLPAFSEDRLLASLCGGLLSGVGIALVMLRFASTGGGEVVARLLQKRWPHLSMGRLILTVDAVVVTLSAVVFGELSAALYAAVQVFVCSVVVDQIVYGREEGRLLLVVTRYPQTLCQTVLSRLSRGVTVVSATGGYSGEDKALLLCAVSRAQVPLLKMLVGQADAGAFVMMVDTRRVMGEGFASLDDAE